MDAPGGMDPSVAGRPVVAGYEAAEVSAVSAVSAA
jgi:hypothetical protein